MKLILSFFILCSSPVSWGCLNTYAENRSGEGAEDVWGGLGIFYRSFDTLFSRVMVEDYEENGVNYSFEQKSDIAIHLTHLTRYEEALLLIRELHEAYPEEYSIIANLGTIYELNGELDSAYKYINKSIEIDSNSHQGSEWVHLEILKAKMKMEKDPNWVYEHPVIYLGSLHKVKEMDPFAIERILGNISWQMEERIPFTPEPDPLIANIFKELGKGYEEFLSIQDGLIAYQIGMVYDPEDRFGIKALYEDLRPIVEANESITKSDFSTHFPEKEKFSKNWRATSKIFDEYEIEHGIDPVLGRTIDTFWTTTNYYLLIGSILFIAILLSIWKWRSMDMD